MKAGNIDAFIIDASVVLAFLLPDEQNAFVEEIFDRYHQKEITLVSTYLLSFEVINTIRTALIRKRIDVATAEGLVASFHLLRIQEKPVDMFTAFTVMIDNNLSYYDASYAALSLEKALPLLTLDKKLQSLAKKRG